MQLPDRIPKMKWITLLWGANTVVWAVLESGLLMTVFTAVFTALLLSCYLFNRFLGGRMISTGSWLALSTAIGAIFGMGCCLLTLTFMAFKTGLHAHGPEFSTAELNWVLQQIPLWTLVGLLIGLGLGLLFMAGSRQAD